MKSTNQRTVLHLDFQPGQCLVLFFFWAQTHPFFMIDIHEYKYMYAVRFLSNRRVENGCVNVGSFFVYHYCVRTIRTNNVGPVHQIEHKPSNTNICHLIVTDCVLCSRSISIQIVYSFFTFFRTYMTRMEKKLSYPHICVWITYLKQGKFSKVDELVFVYWFQCSYSVITRDQLDMLLRAYNCIVW